MVIPILLFWLLLGWSLYDGDIDPREGFIFAGIWVGLLILFIALNILPLWFVVPTVILDIVLILKIFGQDIQIR